jgi:hypothetical protein
VPDRADQGVARSDLRRVTVAKHIETLGSYENFRAPWETEGGEDAEIDKTKLRRLIYNVRADLAKAKDAHDETKATLTAVETERDEAKDAVAKANGDEAQKTIDRLTAENTTLKAAAKAREEADEHEALRKEVLGDLDPKYAKYVQGADREALEKSLESVREDFGLEDPENDPENEPNVRTTPRTLRNAGDPAGRTPADQEYDYDKAADEILGVGPFG